MIGGFFGRVLSFANDNRAICLDPFFHRRPTIRQGAWPWRPRKALGQSSELSGEGSATNTQ